MAGLAISLQILGLVLILIGVVKASLALGTLQTWLVSAWLPIRAVWAMAVKWWHWHVLRKRPGGARPSTIGVTVHVPPANARGDGGVAWVSLSVEKQVAQLRVDIDGLRGSLYAAENQLRTRLDEISGRLTEHESEIDERLAGIDSREAEILGWELAGAACSLLGTFLFLIA